MVRRSLPKYLREADETDERENRAGRFAVRAFGGTVEPFVQQMECFLPDPEERRKFAEKVKEEHLNPAYHLYSPL